MYIYPFVRGKTGGNGKTREKGTEEGVDAEDLFSCAETLGTSFETIKSRISNVQKRRWPFPIQNTFPFFCPPCYGHSGPIRSRIAKVSSERHEQLLGRFASRLNEDFQRLSAVFIDSTVVAVKMWQSCVFRENMFLWDLMGVLLDAASTSRQIGCYRYSHEVAYRWV